MTFKFGLVIASTEQAVWMDGVKLANHFRELGFAVSTPHGRKAVKSQLSYLRQTGFNDYLLYVQDGKGAFEIQDTHEYPDWMARELGTKNFERHAYPVTREGVVQCIAEQVAS